MTSTSSLALLAQLQAVQNQINALTGTATPQDVAYLAKAIETIGGHASIVDIINSGTEQVGLVEQAGALQMAEVNNAGLAEIDAINNVGNTLISDLNTAGNTQVLNINAALLGGTASVVDVPGDASLTVLPSTIKPIVLIRSPKGLAMRTAIVKLPDATTVNLPFDMLDIVNTSWAIVRLQNSAGTDIGYIGPKGSAKVGTNKKSAVDWSASAFVEPWLDPDVEAFTFVNGSAGYYQLPINWYHSSYNNSINPYVNISGGPSPGNYYSALDSNNACAVLDDKGQLAKLAFFAPIHNGVYSTFGFRHKKLPNDTTFYDTWENQATNNNAAYPSELFFNGTSPAISYVGVASGLKTLAAAAGWFSSVSRVGLFVGDYAGNTAYLSSIVVGSTAPVSAIQVLAFGSDDRTLCVIVPTAAGRTLYRFAVGANGALTAKGSAAFSTTAKFVKLSNTRIFVLDGGASGVYAMDDAASTITLKSATASAIYNAIDGSNNTLVGSYLHDGIGILGNANIVLAADDTVSVNTGIVFNLADNSAHTRDGIFSNADNTGMSWLNRNGVKVTASLSANNYYNRFANLSSSLIAANYPGGMVGIVKTSQTSYSVGSYTFGFGIDALKGGK